MNLFPPKIIFSALLMLPLLSIGQSADDYHQMALKAITVMDYPAAMKMLDKGLASDQGNVALHLERGVVLLEMEKYDKAREDFNVILRADSNVVNANIGLSQYYRLTNKPDSAIYYALKAVRLSQDRFQKSRSKIFLAEAYREYGEDALALTYLKDGLADDSANVSGYKAAAEISMEIEEFENAYHYLQQANIYLQEDMENLINLAYVANMLEYNRDALEYCNQALNLDPQQPLALSNRAYAYLQLNQLELAESDIQKSLTNNKANPMAYRYAGEIYTALGKEQKACKYFQEASKLGYTELYGDFVVTQISTICK